MTADEFAANLGTGTEEYADSFHRTLAAATERLAEAQRGDEAGDDLAARIVHRLTCSRCRQGWSCGGLGEDDFDRGAGIADLLAARDAEQRRLGREEGAGAERGLMFRVEVACDGYANLMDSDVPDGIADLAAYQEGAHDAAEAIRAAAQQVSGR